MILISNESFTLIHMLYPRSRLVPVVGHSAANGYLWQIDRVNARFSLKVSTLFSWSNSNSTSSSVLYIPNRKDIVIFNIDSILFMTGSIAVQCWGDSKSGRITEVRACTAILPRDGLCNVGPQQTTETAMCRVGETVNRINCHRDAKVWTAPPECFH